jgi:hypothetical protein
VLRLVVRSRLARCGLDTNKATYTSPRSATRAQRCRVARSQGICAPVSYTMFNQQARMRGAEGARERCCVMLHVR